ncbi:hypothetical protein D3C72_1155280 [compost metagenome]
MVVAPGEGTQVGDDGRHSPGEFADLAQVAAGVVEALVVQQHAGVVGVAADGREGLVQLVADARRHGAQGRQLAGLHQFVLGAHQFLLGLFTLQYFVLEAAVQRFEVLGTFLDAQLQLMAGAGVEGDAVEVVAPPLHHQAEQQQQGEQRGAADGHGGGHLAVDQLARGEDAGGQAGLLELAALGEPGLAVQLEGRWR